MNAGSLEGALRLQKLLVFSIISLLVLVLGYTLADDAFFAAFAFGGLAWLILMPYHATLSVVCAVATFSTALILPFFPGRPFIWEAAALLGWTGCVLVFSFRQYRDEMWDSIFEHKWMLLGKKWVSYSKPQAWIKSLPLPRTCTTKACSTACRRKS